MAWGIDVGVEALAHKASPGFVAGAKKALSFSFEEPFALHETGDAAGHRRHHANVQSAGIGEDEGGAAPDDEDAVVALQGKQRLNETAEVDAVADRTPPLGNDGLDRPGDRLIEDSKLGHGKALALSDSLEDGPVGELNAGRLGDGSCDLLSPGFGLTR